MKGNSRYQNALAAASLVCFIRKVGDLSSDWLSNTSGHLHKKLVVCSAFLDPVEHSLLPDMCVQIPGLNYEKAIIIIL